LGQEALQDTLVEGPQELQGVLRRRAAHGRCVPALGMKAGQEKGEKDQAADGHPGLLTLRTGGPNCPESGLAAAQMLFNSGALRKQSEMKQEDGARG